MLEKWKKAVIHLECATESEHLYEWIKRLDQQRALLKQGEITFEQFAKEIAGRARDMRFHGTALFLSHAGRRYLLTARHVVWDSHSAMHERAEDARRASSTPDYMRHDEAQRSEARAQDRIFNLIFRVPSLDDVIAQRSTPTLLMNLGAGGSEAYTFSEAGTDLALISLDQRDSRFADELTEIGFVPIASEDIADGPDAEGQEVLTVGFPSSTALIGQIEQHPGSAHWSSSHYSLPVSSFGRVSMLHDALPFFWADMSIYPGNSGGPVVANNRLVGVVSAQAVVPIDGVPNPDIRMRIPFACIIKTGAVRALLKTQEEKDQYVLTLFGSSHG
jgi:hypothetical protein